MELLGIKVQEGKEQLAAERRALQEQMQHQKSMLEGQVGAGGAVLPPPPPAPLLPEHQEECAQQVGAWE